jgi:hypothetical protein
MIEVVLTTVLVGTCVSIAVLCLRTLRFTDHQLRDDWQFASNLSRLELQLRRDAYLTQSTKLTEKSAVLQLAAARRIEYQAEPKKVLRTEILGEETIRREIYFLPEEATVLWREREREGAAYLEVEIQRETLALLNQGRHGRPATQQQLQWAKWLMQLPKQTIRSREEKS